MPEDLYRLHRLTVDAPGVELYAAINTTLPALSRRRAREAVMGGLVTINGTPAHEPRQLLPEGRQIVTVDLRHGIDRALRTRLHDGIVNPGKPFTILHEDGQLLIVDKAPGIVSAPIGDRGLGTGPERGHLPELVRRAMRKRGRDLDYLGVVHRLDKETSGCICFALTRDAQRMLSAQFAGQAAGRSYRALVMGQPRKDSDTLRGKLGRGPDGRRAVVDEDEEGKEAVTHFQVLRRFAQGAELEVNLETGRTHQIRVALADIGSPVYGDHVYGWKPRPGQVLLRAPRLMLHAFRLALDHPLNGRRIEVTAPIPDAFSEFSREMDRPAPPPPADPRYRE